MSTNFIPYDPDAELQLFLVCHPGLEQWLGQELEERGYRGFNIEKGGIALTGCWADVADLNVHIRGATRVLVRVAAFSAVHFAQLDKRLRQIPWQEWLPTEGSVTIDATAKRSRLYHSKAISERAEKAIYDQISFCQKMTFVVLLRLVKDWCVVSLDTSGDPLYKRGGSKSVGRAPMRETMAALFLRAAKFSVNQPVYDPMCGSGTFVHEAAGRALGKVAGADRSFAFQNFPAFLNGNRLTESRVENCAAGPRCFGADRDAGAIRRAKANSMSQGLEGICHFECQAISDARPPSEVPGLVISNPPYGGRIGERAKLQDLYAAFGSVMRRHFSGWRIALITSDVGLANATRLPFLPAGPVVSHGGIQIRLWQTAHGLENNDSSEKSA